MTTPEFTPLQLRILEMLCLGLPPCEIARTLHLTPGSVSRRHAYNIRRKICQSLGRPPGYMTQTRLLIWALREGIVMPPELTV